MENNIKDQIIEIAYNVLNVDVTKEENIIDERKLLHIIISESNKALEFVTLIEDEFDVEFDDEDVNLEFFQNIDNIVERLKRYL